MSQDNGVGDYYVTLTGGKNNAGDFLIKKRTLDLLGWLRPDRAVVDYDAWIEIDNEKLDVINNAKALLLTGGPALQKNMYPGIYRLRKNLDEIKAPIITLGIGWKSLRGSWEDTRNYDLSKESICLLERIDSSGYLSSVRDRFTQEVLNTIGFQNFLTTGCPALFDQKTLERVNASGQESVPPRKIRTIGFSLGVSFLESREMETQMKEMIIGLREGFPETALIVAFHHGTTSRFLNTHNARKQHLAGHQKFINWLNKYDVKHIDISGSAKNLIDFYGQVDLHVGYRVHAHIYMCSVDKPSILIAEDGRGRALKTVLPFNIKDAFDDMSNSIINKVLRKLKIYSGYKVSNCASNEILRYVRQECQNDFPLIDVVNKSIQVHSKIMQKFVSQLP